MWLVTCHSWLLVWSDHPGGNGMLIEGVYKSVRFLCSILPISLIFRKTITIVCCQDSVSALQWFIDLFIYEQVRSCGWNSWNGMDSNTSTRWNGRHWRTRKLWARLELSIRLIRTLPSTGSSKLDIWYTFVCFFAFTEVILLCIKCNIQFCHIQLVLAWQ